MLVSSWLAYEFILAEYDNSTETEYLFVYGTLKNHLIRFYACRCVATEDFASLDNFKKIGLNIVPEQSSVVDGKLLKVTSLELERFDTYENTPEKYQRMKVTLQSGNKAWVYIK